LQPRATVADSRRSSSGPAVGNGARPYETSRRSGRAHPPAHHLGAPEGVPPHIVVSSAAALVAALEPAAAVAQPRLSPGSTANDTPPGIMRMPLFLAVPGHETSWKVRPIPENAPEHLLPFSPSLRPRGSTSERFGARRR